MSKIRSSNIFSRYSIEIYDTQEHHRISIKGKLIIQLNYPSRDVHNHMLIMTKLTAHHCSNSDRAVSHVFVSQYRKHQQCYKIVQTAHLVTCTCSTVLL